MKQKIAVPNFKPALYLEKPNFKIIHGRNALLQGLSKYLSTQQFLGKGITNKKLRVPSVQVTYTMASKVAVLVSIGSSVVFIA